MKRVALVFLLFIVGFAATGEEILLNYRDAQIDQVLQFFSLASGKTIVKDPQVTGTVTIISQEKVTLAEGFQILETILGLRGFTLVEDQRLIQVLPVEKAIGKGGQVVVGSLPKGIETQGLVTQIIPLKNLKAGELATQLTPFFPSAACILALESSNTLILTNHEPQLRQVEGIIELLESHQASKRREDVVREQLPKAKPYKIIPLKHLNAQTLAQQLAPLLNRPMATLPQMGAGVRQPTTGRGTEQAEMMLFQQLAQLPQSKDGLVENQIIADLHTNSVIITGSREVLDLIAQIIAELDVPLEDPAAGQRVVRLKFANAQNAVNILNTIYGDGSTRLVMPTQRNVRSGSTSLSFMPTPAASQDKNIRFAADNTTNSVVVMAPEALLPEIVALLLELDREAAGGTELQATAVIRLEKADAAQIADLLNQVLNLSYRWNQQGQGAVDQATLQEMMAGLGLDPELIFAWPVGTQVRVAADRGSNSLVVTASLSAIAQLEALVSHLDQEGAPASSVIVHRLQNARASELAATLNQLFRSTSTPTTRQTTRNMGYNPYMMMQPASPSVSILDQNIQVVADDVSNSLLVAATPQALDEIKRIIHELDVMPPQVLIEAVVMEVTLDESTDLGLELSFALGNGTGGINWDLGSGPGFRFGTVAGDLTATISALSKTSQVDILATPKIATANNKQASINIGHQFPYLTGSKRDEDGNIQNTYTYKDVGIKLEVTPRICESGQIALDVYQTSNSFANDLIVEGGMVIAQREAKTSVIVRDGETMVIGGMIKDDTSQYTRKVPILGSLPLLGALFRRQETVKRKTELVVFLTPHIVREGGGDCNSSQTPPAQKQ